MLQFVSLYLPILCLVMVNRMLHVLKYNIVLHQVKIDQGPQQKKIIPNSGKYFVKDEIYMEIFNN